MRKLFFELSLARKLSFSGQRSISGLVIKLAVVSIVVAVAVMEVVISIVFGFEHEIQRKVMGFGSHIQIGTTLKDLDSKVEPLARYGTFVGRVRSIEGVSSVSPFVELPCMIKTKVTQEGILMKGVDADYNWSFFSAALIEGKLPDLSGPEESKEILISKKLAQLLGVEVGKNPYVYFFKDRGRNDTSATRDPGQLVDIRKVKISGIYETGMEEFDKVRVICDLRLVQRVLSLPEDRVSGFEVILKDTDQLEEISEQVDRKVRPLLQAYPITEIYPEIFEWLQLQHQNVWFILILLVIIALINLTGVVLIIILERTQTIGLLKALGLSNFRVRRVFIFNAAFLIILGLLLGNLLGLGLIWSQSTWGWLQVDQVNYFVKTVPVAWTWIGFLLINLGVMAACTLFMLVPSVLVTKISPSRSLRFQ